MRACYRSAMSARAPRRSFLNPFVVTLAAAPACFVQSRTPPSQSVSQPNPGQPETTDPHPTPPPPEAQTPTIIANPPRPTDPQPASPPPPDPVQTEAPLIGDPPANDAEWIVTKTTSGCRARAITHCPPKMMCNPPPPHIYQCIDGAKYPATLTKHGEVCTLEAVGTAPCPK
jgi:hypothetical protein